MDNVPIRFDYVLLVPSAPRIILQKYVLNPVKIMKGFRAIKPEEKQNSTSSEKKASKDSVGHVKIKQPSLRSSNVKV
jgi:hypothetical protein